MEHAARRFARWVLGIHLLVLIVIIVLVLLAAREIYLSARDQALEQARGRQELLATQTARGIENFYRSILDNLDLQRRAEETDEPPGATEPSRMIPLRSRMPLGPLMWDQLRGRASHVFTLERRTMTVPRDFTDDHALSADQIVKAASAWLEPLDKPAISSAYHIGEQWINLIAVPIRGPARRVLIAVVPAKQIDNRFLGDVNRIKLVSATVIDASGQIIAAFDPRMLGLRFGTDASDPGVRELAKRYQQAEESATEIIDRPVDIGPVHLVSAMATVQPIQIAGGTWRLVLASALDEVDAVVQRTLRRAAMWAVFVVVSMTAVLVSTSFHMIRTRLRLERIQRALLQKELSAARDIQLAWLPQRHGKCRGADIAAINQPASHVSGDFYNWFELPNGRSAVLIGDVTGHGMSAAFLMATTQLLVRTTMSNAAGPGECLEEVNRQLCVQGFSGQFVTMLLLVLDSTTCAIQIATAGHPPPLVANSREFHPLTIEPQLVLGVDPAATYPTESFDLRTGETLLLYTDGVTDVFSATSERFGLTRLKQAIPADAKCVQDLLDEIVKQVDLFRRGRPLDDDLTLVAIAPSAPRPAVANARSAAVGS